MIQGPWKAVTIDIDRVTEFTGDDVDRYSDLCDLGDSYNKVTVFIPALSTSGIVSVYVQRDDGVDTVPVISHVMDRDATGSFANSTSSGGGSIVVTFEIGAIEYLRLHVSHDQSTDRIFYVRGFNG